MYESFTALDVVRAAKLLREYGDCLSLYPEHYHDGVQACAWTVYAPDATLLGVGPGGYPTAYYLLNHNGWHHEGEVLCADCANKEIRQWWTRREFKAIAEHTGNGDYSDGLACDECSQWIVPPDDDLAE